MCSIRLNRSSTRTRTHIGTGSLNGPRWWKFSTWNVSSCSRFLRAATSIHVFFPLLYFCYFLFTGSNPILSFSPISISLDVAKSPFPFFTVRWPSSMLRHEINLRCRHENFQNSRGQQRRSCSQSSLLFTDKVRTIIWAEINGQRKA